MSLRVNFPENNVNLYMFTNFTFDVNTFSAPFYFILFLIL
jgi:hypothetical protein